MGVFMGKLLDKIKQGLISDEGTDVPEMASQGTIEAGFEGVKKDIKRARKPKIEPQIEVETQHAAQYDEEKASVMTSSIPVLVATLYERGIDIISIALLYTMGIPSNFYERNDRGQDPITWANSAIEYSY